MGQNYIGMFSWCQENKYLGDSLTLHVFHHEIVFCVCSLESLIDAILISTLNIPLHVLLDDIKDFPKLSQFASWPGAMINSIARTTRLWNNHGPKDVRAIEVRLYFGFCTVSVGWKRIICDIYFWHCRVLKNASVTRFITYPFQQTSVYDSSTKKA